MTDREKLRKAIHITLFAGIGFFILRALGVFSHPWMWLSAILVLAAIGGMLPDTDAATRAPANDGQTYAQYMGCRQKNVGAGDEDSLAKYCKCQVNTYADVVKQHISDEQTMQNNWNYEIRQQCSPLLH